MQNKSIAILAFALFVATTATLFLRPAEVFEFLAGLPIYEVLILSSLALAFQAFLGHFRWFMLRRQPVTLCVVGIFISIALSHLQHLYGGGILDGGTMFLKTLIYYGLLITTVNTPSRLKAFLLAVAICVTAMVGMCVLDYYEIYEFEFIVHLEDFDRMTDEGERIMLQRMRGTGIFQDPNDIAMVIAATGVICAYFLTDRSLGPSRFLWLGPMLVLVIGLLSTKSRGGLMAAAAAGLVVLAVRYGGRVAIIAGIAGACLLPLLGGRQTEAGLEEGGTAHERVELWKEGFQEIKSAAIVFGTGQGTYVDIAGQPAHNSYIHSYVELGFFGGTMFTGLFFFIGMQLYRIGRLNEPLLNDDLARMRPFIAGMITGACVSIFSLSRCYVVSTYVFVGICTAYLNLIWIHTESGRPLVIMDKIHAARLTVASVMTLVGLYAFMTILK